MAFNGFSGGRHSAPLHLPAWLLPAVGGVTAAALAVTGVLAVTRSLQHRRLVPAAASSAVSAPLLTTAPATTETATTTETPTTTTTTTGRTTRKVIPSVKPPVIRVEQNEVTTTKRTETRVTGTHTDYQPVRPDRVSLPDLPHLYGSNGQLVGIDVWRGTEEIDWPTVKQAGIRFAMIRCGYRTTVGGVVYKDANFDKNIRGALDAGMPVGVYFFSAARTRQEALEEAAFTLEVIKEYNITWPVAYDFETFGSDRLTGVSNTTITDNAMAFMDYIAQNGYTPVLYSYRNALWNNWEAARLGAYRVWMAQYAELPKKSYGGDHAIWQCASDGIVPGIAEKNYVDLNIAYMDFSKPHTALLNEPDPSTFPTEFSGFSFTEVSDKVALQSACALRIAPDEKKPNIWRHAEKGLTLVRTGVDEKTGWSRLLLNGVTVYCPSDKLQYLGQIPTTTTTTTTTTTVTTTTSASATGTTTTTAADASIPPTTQGTTAAEEKIQKKD